MRRTLFAAVMIIVITWWSMKRFVYSNAYFASVTFSCCFVMPNCLTAPLQDDEREEQEDSFIFEMY